MTDPRWESLAAILIDHSIRLREGETLLIECFDPTDPASPRILIRNAAARGARVLVKTRDTRIVSAIYLRVAGANNSIVRDARVFLASPWSRRRLAMGPYSMDLRERVAAVIDEGEGSQRQVAKRFRVSVSFVTRLIQRRREAGTLAPKAHGGGRGRPSASPNGYAWRC